MSSTPTVSLTMCPQPFQGRRAEVLRLKWHADYGNNLTIKKTYFLENPSVGDRSHSEDWRSEFVPTTNSPSSAIIGAD